MTGRMPAEGINPIEFPLVLAEEWSWFLSLNASRQSGMEPSPITESEIGCFFQNRRIRPELWQIDVIRALDIIALESTRENK